MSADYYNLYACAKQHGFKPNVHGLAKAQRILTDMVKTGAAAWWPGREMIAVNRGEQGQLPLGAKE